MTLVRPEMHAAYEPRFARFVDVARRISR